MTTIPVLAFLSFSALAILIWMYTRLALPRDSDTDLSAWWSAFEPARYNPMVRLLSPRDCEFLRTLPGFRPGLDRRLRRQRIRVFEAYLREIRLDFRRLHALAAELALTTSAPELHNQLLRQRVRFTRAIWRIRLALIAHRLGLSGVDATALVDALRVTTQLFQPALAAAAH